VKILELLDVINFVHYEFDGTYQYVRLVFL